MTHSRKILEQSLQGRALEDIFVIDAHGHLDLWKSSNVKEEDACAKGLIEHMDRVGIDRLCINKWNCPHPGANEDTAEAIERYPDRFIGFAVAFPSLGADKVTRELTRCFDEFGFYGIKVHESYTQLCKRDHTNLQAFEEAMEAVWHFANERRCPVLCHGYLNVDIAKRFPNAKFLAAHAGGAPKTAETFIDCPNVYLDSAASTLMRSNIEVQVRTVGKHRVLYGSDMPYADPGFRIGQVIACRLPDEVMRLILGLNMASVCGIEVPARYQRKGEDSI